MSTRDVGTISKDALRILRTTRGWSQPRLAQEANLSQAVVSRIETGEDQHIKLTTALKLAYALDVPLEALLTTLDDEQPLNPIEALELLLERARGKAATRPNGRQATDNRGKRYSHLVPPDRRISIAV